MARTTLEALSLYPSRTRIAEYDTMEEAFFAPDRIKYVMGGERSGKSFHGAMYLVCRHGFGELFWLVAEEYETCVPEFDYTCDFLGKIDAYEPRSLSSPKEGSKSVRTRDGTLIETRSASDYRRIAEKAPDGVVGCEVGRWTWQTFLRVSGRLAEKRAWAWLSGSFEGSLGWQAEKHAQWRGPNLEQARSFSVPTAANEFIFPGGEDDPEIQRLVVSQPHDYVMERYYGQPVPPTGRVYRYFEYVTHVSEDAEYKKGLPVEVWIDPGYAGAYVVLAVQCLGEYANVVDEVYVQRLTNSEIITLCTKKPWWKDVQPSGVIDIAGRGHTSERSPIEAWQNDAGIYLSSEFVHIRDSIERVNAFLRPDSGTGRPGLLVHPRCVGLIAEMGAGKHPIEGMGVYRYPTDSLGNVLSEKPLDKNNHACSALAYGLVHKYGIVRKTAGMSENYRMGGGKALNYRKGWGKMDFDDEAESFLQAQAARDAREPS